MENTINNFAKIAMISTRTLRYYDQIGLLKPKRITQSGYRIYGSDEVDRLQQILFYKEMGFELGKINSILSSPSFDVLNALKEHKKNLYEKRNRLDLLILNVEKTIMQKEGRIKMNDREKFEGFKKKMIDDNEIKYGKEIREKYGEEKVEISNAKLKSMTKEQYEVAENLGNAVIETLIEAINDGNPEGELAWKVADMHKRWLCYFWDSYSKEAHAGLANMYVEDERFTKYYDDKAGRGAAKFLRDAILVYTGYNE